MRTEDDVRVDRDRCNYISPVDGRRCVEEMWHPGMGHFLADSDEEETLMLTKRGFVTPKAQPGAPITEFDDLRRSQEASQKLDDENASIVKYHNERNAKLGLL